MLLVELSNGFRGNMYYRFRRIANRKNHTKRPMQLYKESDFDKTLFDLGIDKRQHIYLEQDTNPSMKYN